MTTYHFRDGCDTVAGVGLPHRVRHNLMYLLQGDPQLQWSARCQVRGPSELGAQDLVWTGHLTSSLLIMSSVTCFPSQDEIITATIKKQLRGLLPDSDRQPSSCTCQRSFVSYPWLLLIYHFQYISAFSEDWAEAGDAAAAQSRKQGEPLHCGHSDPEVRHRCDVSNVVRDSR